MTASRFTGERELNVHTDSTLEATAPDARTIAIAQLVARIRSEQNLGLGIAGGLVGALLGAVIWAAVSAATHYRIGYMSIGVGFLVGYGVKTLGRGIDRSFGIAGAVFALLGCIAGNLGTVILAVSDQAKVPVTTILDKLSPNLALEMLKIDFQPMDVLFYAIALYFGYKYSFRRLTQDEIAALPD